MNVTLFNPENLPDIVSVTMSISLGTYFAWRFISCFMVFMKSLHSHTAFVVARSLQAHGYTTDGELTELKRVADAGGEVAGSAVKWFTFAVFFLCLGMAGY
ncbi:TMhelix containing protein [Vibrio phage 1.244.A._10N.261.54.C3]|nr:TMhelix containing protein [Vibrio phage 1.244.A._10N.261.54.C3]AUR98695.1 TMhelix containing protein [Vibrio phage 1.255.O._10N.286.45.F1]